MSESCPRAGKETAVKLIGLLAFALAIALPLVMKAAFLTGEAVAVVFPPWTDHDVAIERIVAAEGTFIRSGGVPWIVIARSDDPAFSRRLYHEGAWLVGNAMTDAGCAAPSSGAAT